MNQTAHLCNCDCSIYLVIDIQIVFGRVLLYLYYAGIILHMKYDTIRYERYDLCSKIGG